MLFINQLKTQFINLPITIAMVMLILLLSGCQSQPHHLFATAAPLGQQQILVTFDKAPTLSVLPGGSARSYRGGGDWAVPLSLQSKISSLEQSFALRKQKVWPMESINRHCVVFTVDKRQDIDTLLEEITTSRGVITAQRMHLFETMLSTKELSSEVLSAEALSNNKFLNKVPSYNDTHLDIQYGQYVDTLTHLHSLGRGEAIKIGVVDTLSDHQHPDLLDQINRQYQYVATTTDNQTHGTAMAGIISARANNNTGLVGLAPDAVLNIYAACESSQGEKARCNSFNILQALEQAIKDEVHILNLSIAGPYDELIEAVINVAHKQGIVVIAAINGQARSKSFPATMDVVVGVEAIPEDTAVEKTMSEKTASEQPNNPMRYQDLFGDWLSRSEKLSTLSGGGYRFFTGSSISTASISGVAVLVRQQHSAQKTHDYIKALADGDCDYLSSMSDLSVASILQKSTTCQATDVRQSRYK